MIPRLPFIAGLALAGAGGFALVRGAPSPQQQLEHVVLQAVRRSGPTRAPASDRVTLAVSRDAVVAVTRDAVGGRDSWFLHLANQDVYELETDAHRQEVAKLLPIP
jgi:hypothetical protein